MRVVWNVMLVLAWLKTLEGSASFPVPSGLFPSLAQEDTLLGDWAGWRSAMTDRGVEIIATYANDLQANVHGGKHHGFANAGVLYVRAEADLERVLMCCQGLSLVTSVTFRSGQNLSGDAIGNLFPVAQLAGGSTYFLDELYLKQNLGEETFCKFGRMVADYDFATSEFLDLYVTFAINSSPISIFFDSPFPSDPFATWGAYCQISPKQNLICKFGIYTGNLLASSNRYHGVNWTFAHPNGLILISQIDYHLPSSLPGNYRFGAYYLRGSFATFLDGNRNGNWAVYCVLDQALWKHDTTSITPWLTALWAPQQDRNPIPWFLAGGVTLKGLRNEDSLNLGYAIGWLSSDLREAEELGINNRFFRNFGNFPQYWESVLELNYALHVNPWMVCSPVIQWIGNPGATHKIRDAIVIGVQFAAVL